MPRDPVIHRPHSNGGCARVHVFVFAWGVPRRPCEFESVLTPGGGGGSGRRRLNGKTAFYRTTVENRYADGAIKPFSLPPPQKNNTKNSTTRVLHRAYGNRKRLEDWQQVKGRREAEISRIYQPGQRAHNFQATRSWTAARNEADPNNNRVESVDGQNTSRANNGRPP